MAEEFFCIDEASFFHWLEKHTNPDQVLLNLLDLVEELKPRHIIAVSEQIDAIEIGEGLFFYDIYSLDFKDIDVIYKVSRDTYQRLLATRREFDDFACGVEQYSMFNNDAEEVRQIANSGYLNIIYDNRTSEDITCLLIMENELQSREHFTKSGEETRHIFAIHSISQVLDYYRYLLINCKRSEKHFFESWDLAFPNLIKSKDLTFNKFEGGFEGLKSDVVKHLAFLNDSFLDICSVCNYDFPKIMALARAKYSIELSNESAKTRADTKKMRERDVVFSDSSVSCECHTKIKYDKNRIHFHLPIDKIDKTKILIGIFVDHLSI